MKTLTFKKLSGTLMLLLTLLNTAPSANAGEEGGLQGGGGDARCAKFYELASQVSISLAKVGQTAVDQVNPLINVQQIRNVILHPLTVLPTTNLDRQARSNPATITTTLDVQKWDLITTLQERARLVSHELMVLAGVEADGEYTISQDLMKILLEKTDFFKTEKITCLMKAIELHDNNKDSREGVGAGGLLLVTLPCYLVGVFNPYALPFVIGGCLTAVGATEVSLFISDIKHKNMIQLIKDAQLGDGEQLSKYYNKYIRKISKLNNQNHTDKKVLSKEEFRQFVITGNEDGTLCGRGMKQSTVADSIYYLTK